MSGYSGRENVRRVAVVGLATIESRGLSAIYRKRGSKGPTIKDIPDEDWTNERKQLRVTPIVSDKNGVQKGERDPRFHFNVNIPANFFEENKFIASPKYSRDEMLHAKLTGYGLGAGYIDLNVQGRSAGGSSTVSEVGCAKWS